MYNKNRSKAVAPFCTLRTLTKLQLSQRKRIKYTENNSRFESLTQRNDRYFYEKFTTKAFESQIKITPKYLRVYYQRSPKEFRRDSW